MKSNHGIKVLVAAGALVIMGGLAIYASAPRKGRGVVTSSASKSTAAKSSMKQARSENDLVESFKNFAQGDPNKVEAFLKQEFTKQGYGQLYVHKNGQTDFLNIGQISTVRSLFDGILKELTAVNNEREYAFWNGSAKALLKFSEAPAKKSGHQWIKTAPDILTIADAKGLGNIARIKQQRQVGLPLSTVQELAPVLPEGQTGETARTPEGAPAVVSEETGRTPEQQVSGTTETPKQEPQLQPGGGETQADAAQAAKQAEDAAKKAGQAEQRLEEGIAADVQKAAQEKQSLEQLQAELKQAGEQVKAKQTILDRINILKQHEEFKKVRQEAVVAQMTEFELARKLEGKMDETVDTSSQVTANVADISAAETPQEGSEESGKKKLPGGVALQDVPLGEGAAAPQEQASWFSWKKLALGSAAVGAFALAFYNREQLPTIDWTGFGEKVATVVPGAVQSLSVQQAVGAVAAGTVVLASLGYVYVYSGKKQDPAVVNAALTEAVKKKENAGQVKELVTGADALKKQTADYAALSAEVIALEAEIDRLMKDNPVIMAQSVVMQQKVGQLTLLKQELRKRGKALKKSNNEWRKNALIFVGAVGVVAAVAYGINWLWNRAIIAEGKIENLEDAFREVSGRAARLETQQQNTQAAITLLGAKAKRALDEAIKAKIDANLAIVIAEQALDAAGAAAESTKAAELAAEAAKLFANQSAKNAAEAASAALAAQTAAGVSAEGVLVAAGQAVDAQKAAEVAQKIAQKIGEETSALLQANGNSMQAALTAQGAIVEAAGEVVNQGAKKLAESQITIDALAAQQGEVIAAAGAAAAGAQQAAERATEALNALNDASSKSFLKQLGAAIIKIISLDPRYYWLVKAILEEGE